MRKLVVAAVLVAVGIVFFLLPGGRALSQQIVQVLVTNFPETFKVDGTVAVKAPVPHSKTVRMLEVVVPPVGRGETGSLIEGDLIDTAGFTEVVLSLQGIVKGTLGQGGSVGAVMTPVEEAMETSFGEGTIQLPLEVVSVLARQEIETFSNQSFQTIGFPQYKVYFYNSTDKAVEVNLYLYLTN
ncbi:MAG: hypothetical protein GY719_18415 [bacterium]|nr:hypothetical protein [bacterium]